MKVEKCLIPAAGIGLRARPHTHQIPKALLRVADKPLIQHTIEMVRDQLGIHSFVVVTGHLGSMIREHLEGLRLDVNIEFIENTGIDKGLSWSILLARKVIRKDFLTILGDEFYHRTNHCQFTQPLDGKTFCRCGAFNVDDREIIRQNYTMEVRGNRIHSLQEKPAHPTTQLMGCGSFIFTPTLFDELEKAFIEQHSPDFISLLNELCQSGLTLESFHLTGEYVNVNDIEALVKANMIFDNTER